MPGWPTLHIDLCLHPRLFSYGRFLVSRSQRIWTFLRLLINIVKLPSRKAGLGSTPHAGPQSVLKWASDASLPCLSTFSFWLPIQPPLSYLPQKTMEKVYILKYLSMYLSLSTFKSQYNYSSPIKFNLQPIMHLAWSRGCFSGWSGDRIWLFITGAGISTAQAGEAASGPFRGSVISIGSLSALRLWNCANAPVRCPRGLGEWEERELSHLLDTPQLEFLGVCRAKRWLLL